jgi:hypothetical protein
MNWGWVGLNTLIVLLLYRWFPPWPPRSRFSPGVIRAILVATAIFTGEIAFLTHHRSSAGIEIVIRFSLGGIVGWLVSYLVQIPGRAQS